MIRYHFDQRVEVFAPDRQRYIPGTVIAVNVTVTCVRVSLDDRMVPVDVDPSNRFRIRPIPTRIQRRRTKGWRMPEGAVYVGRPTKWGNPYRVPFTYRWADTEPCPYPAPSREVAGAGEQIERCETLHHTVFWYEAWITRMAPALAQDAVAFLAGRDLACWCPLGQPCHADVLLKIANGGASS